MYGYIYIYMCCNSSLMAQPRSAGMYSYIHVCIHVCIYICMYTYIYIDPWTLL